MIGSRGLSSDIRPLLDEERAIPAQPAVVRARAMARARAALAAGIVVAPVEPPPLAPRSRWVASVALACAVSAAVNVAAYQIHAHYARTSAPVTEPAVPAPAPASRARRRPRPAQSSHRSMRRCWHPR